MAYLLGVTTAGVATAAVAVSASPPIGPLDMERSAVLLVSTALYLAWSHRHERARHSLNTVWAHVDFAGLWSVATALVLPAPLVLMMVAVTSLARWSASGEAPHRLLFTTSSTVVAAATVNWLVHSLGLTVRLVERVPDSAPLLVGLLGASLLYATIQAVVLAGERLVERVTPPREIWGAWRENAAASVGCVLGVLAAITLVANPVAVLIIVCIGAAATKAAALADDATYDLRTGLLNPTAWEQQAERAVAQAQRSGRPCSVLFVDADRFKLINDTYGHPAGDAVLRELGELVRGAVRQGDLAGRYGGEQFVVLLPDTTLEHALVLAERIRTSAARVKVATHTTQAKPVTLLGRDTLDPRDRDDRQRTGNNDTEHQRISVSVGVASACGPQLSLKTLTMAADRAVLEAKATGRNRVHADRQP